MKCKKRKHNTIKWTKNTVQQAKALQAASQCLASGWACDRRPQCWASGRHPCGIARDKVEGPVAVVRNAGPVAATPMGLFEIKWMGL